MAIDANLATIANGGQMIVDIDSHIIYYLILNSLKAASAKPFCRASRGWGMFLHKNHATREAKGSIMVGMLVCCVFC